MAQIPWYYKISSIFWKIEDRVMSKAGRSQNSDRGFFNRLPQDKTSERMREALRPVRAEAQNPYFGHRKTMHDNKFL